MTPRLKGFIFATLSVIALCALASTVFFLSPIGAVIGAGLATIIAPIAILVFGVPAHLGLSWLKKTSLRAHLWTGFAISTVLAFGIAFKLPHGGARMMIALFEMTIILLAGPCAAWAFWRTVRPDLPTTSMIALERPSEHLATGVRGLVPERPETRSDPAAPALK